MCDLLQWPQQGRREQSAFSAGGSGGREERNQCRSYQLVTGRPVKGKYLVTDEGTGKPHSSKLDRNLSMATAINIDGMRKTYLGGSYAIVTIETHWRKAVSHPVALSQAVSLKSNSLDSQALLSVFLSSKSSKTTLLS